MLESVWGISDELNALEATQSAIKQCCDKLNGRLPQAGIIVTSCMDADFSDMLTRICDSFPGIELVGCTTDGEISPMHGFSEDSVGLLLFCSEKIRFKAALATDISSSPEESIRQAYNTCKEQLGGEPGCGFIFPDGLTIVDIPMDEIIRKVCGDKVPFFGGAAGDHYEFRKTYQFCKREVSSNGMAILLMSGEMQLTVSVGNGWTPIGPYYTVDKHDKNKVYTIDGMSAKKFYEEHLGMVEPVMSHIPLAVYEGAREKFYLRDSLDVFDDDGSIDFVGTFPAAAKVRLTTVFREDLVRAANDANREVITGCEEKPDLVMVFSCTSRRHILGSRTNEELTGLLERKEVPFFGFYSYGEYAPMDIGGPVLYQNDCYVAVAVREIEE